VHDLSTGDQVKERLQQMRISVFQQAPSDLSGVFAPIPHGTGFLFDISCHPGIERRPQERQDCFRMILVHRKPGLAVLADILLLVLWPPDGNRPRAVQGKVLAPNGEELKGAVVQIKDTRTLWVRSYISEKDGSYQFVGLNPDADYEIFAKYRGRSSSTKTVSQFDSGQLVKIDLVIKTGAP
jgi:hypothetical protein